MRASLISFLTLNIKKGEDTYGKNDKTYIDMIQTFYSNCLIHGLLNINSAIKSQNIQNIEQEIISLQAGAK